MSDPHPVDLAALLVKALSRIEQGPEERKNIDAMLLRVKTNIHEEITKLGKSEEMPVQHQCALFLDIAVNCLLCGLAPWPLAQRDKQLDTILNLVRLELMKDVGSMGLIASTMNDTK